MDQMDLGEIFYDFFSEILDNMLVEKLVRSQNINEHFYVFLYNGVEIG